MTTDDWFGPRRLGFEGRKTVARKVYPQILRKLGREVADLGLVWQVILLMPLLTLIAHRHSHDLATGLTLPEPQVHAAMTPAPSPEEHSRG